MFTCTAGNSSDYLDRILITISEEIHMFDPIKHGYIKRRRVYLNLWEFYDLPNSKSALPTDILRLD